MIQPVREFTVVPPLLASLESLRAVAYNLRWAWSHDSIDLFCRLDDDLWESSGHNPVLMLGSTDQARLEEAASDQGFGAPRPGGSQSGRVYDRQIHLVPSRPRARRWSVFDRLLFGRVWPHRVSGDLCRGWGCWRETISSRPATWASRWLGWGCFTSRGIFGSISTTPAGSRSGGRRWSTS